MSGPDINQGGSLDRGLAILQFLVTAREVPVAEIAEGVALSRSTTYRLMDRLQALGFVVRVGDQGRWKLGPAAARLGAAAAQSADVAHVAPELLRVLVQQTQETVGLGVPGGEDMVFIYRELGPHSIAVNPPLGARRPLHCTSIGKAYLAALPAAEARSLVSGLELVPFTTHTITSREALRVELSTIRRRGWAEDHREFDDTVTCCGAAIRDASGMPVAAISASGPYRRTTPMLSRLGPLVAATAEAISRRLGWTP